MTDVLRVFVPKHLAQVVHQQVAINTTSANCPPFDGTPRTIWGILGSCAFTLLICVWQVIHEDVPPPNQKWYKARLVEATTVLLSFLLPEWTIYVASKEWWAARQKLEEFNGRMSEWSMSHSFFAAMGGFVYCEGKDSFKRINAFEYLDLYERKEIANPDITEQDIIDKSKSDAPGKSILTIQLIWFTVQVSARYFYGFTATLVELDTVCMALLSILLLFFWHKKPLRPKCAHTFYSKQFLKEEPDFNLKEAWKSEPSLWNAVVAFFQVGCTDEKTNRRVDMNNMYLLLHSWWQLIKNQQVDTGGVAVFSLCTTWFIFGVLHLAAWNYPFVTTYEQIWWRAVSLALAATPLVFAVEKGLSLICIKAGWWEETDIMKIERLLLSVSLFLALACRISLAVLMLYTLRSVPCSAFHSIPWTTYIPHL